MGNLPPPVTAPSISEVTVITGSWPMGGENLASILFVRVALNVHMIFELTLVFPSNQPIKLHPS
jgi:hypothetical protein